jgi:uncharacterized protein YbjT (DUF2867 family)
MTVLVIGATGPTGREIVKAVQAQGLKVRALARRPEALADAGVEVAKGDVENVASLRAALPGVSAVVSSLGTPLILKGPVTLLSRGTANILAAMQAEGVDRFLCITGMGAGDSRGHGGFVYDRVILPLLLGRIYADKDRQEAMVRASGLDWTLIRPAYLKSGPGRGTWRAITDWRGQANMTAIDRADVAAFIATELAAHRYGRQTVNLSW